MSVIDVNDAFAAERADQTATAENRNRSLEARLAAGELRKLPDGRYKVLTGWDAGEILSATGAPVHGLDMVNGRAALYSAVPAWHGLGQIIPGGTSSVDDVLTLGGIDFTVEKRPVRYMHGDALRTMTDRWVTVRTDTGEALGTVGAKYEVFQQRELFDFLERLSGQEGVVWESAGPLRGGRRVFVSMRVPEAIVVDRGGLDDEIQLFFACMNCHDASAAAETVVTPWRPVCANTERFALRDATARWGIRHTSGGLEQLAEARRTLGLTMRYAKSFEAEQNALVRTNLAIDEFHKIIGDLWPIDEDASDRKQKNAAERHALLDDRFRKEAERAGGLTAYAAERTVTDYLDHIAPRRASRTMSEEIVRATRLLEGGDDALKSAAHKRLMTLTRR